MGRVLERLPRPLKAGLVRLALGLTATGRRLGWRQPGIVLILAHMRSGSTLLLHLLASHPEILGCGERNRVYGTAADLDRLVLDARYRRRRPLRRYRWVVDQVNHNHLLTAAALLDDPRVRPIFLVREPRASLASMVEVLGKHYGTTLDEAFTYYRERLPALAGYVRGMADPGRAYFLTYDQLTEHTAPTLAGLERHLGLTSTLTATYRRFEFTGHRGDPSPAISSGRVLRGGSRRRLELPAAVGEGVDEIYRECRRELAARCASPPGAV